MAEFTPMMQQYLEVKKSVPDCILFYRLGDFYEMFFEDAKTASRELELTLTGRACGQEERAPMCGVPYHAADSYLSRLVARGYKVAVCDQVEDPKEAKGIVRREIVRIVSPGTSTEPEGLSEGRHNYLMCVLTLEDRSGVAVCDVSTGYLGVTEYASVAPLYDEIIRRSPSEMICSESFFLSGIDCDELREKMGILITTRKPEQFSDEPAAKLVCSQFGVLEPSVLGIPKGSPMLGALGALFAYLREMQRQELGQFTSLEVYENSDSMVIDATARRNLELLETLRDKEKKGSLLWVLDKTQTAMGARALRELLTAPLLDPDELNRRYDALDCLNSHLLTREELREYLTPIYDLERLLTRITIHSAGPKDLLAFASSIQFLPAIRQLLSELPADMFRTLADDLDPLEDLFSLLTASISEDAPISVHDGGILKPGYDDRVDTLRKASTEGKAWIAELETKERERTGIKNLRVRYNRVFGYYIEVTNSYKDLVPEEYVRKQTLAGAERYYTPRLKEMEETILGALDRLNALEYALFCQIRDQVGEEVARIQKTAAVLGQLDVFCSLAAVAEANHYCRPRLNRRGRIRILEGRHPVVEQMLPSGTFVPNDTMLDRDENRLAVITGPNMAGKSTYMRQVALICLMGQVGSFVPAKEADLCICDRIFTRVGASDDLASGQSTFMVEMNEVADILAKATPQSLVILDEIGRGTSTYDGLSIAWAVIEHLAGNGKIAAKTLFATHYHELTELEGRISGVKNYSIAVREKGEEIVFLRKIVNGGADKSYGIQVARLAGLPESVLRRASEILTRLSAKDPVAVMQQLFGQTRPPRAPDEVDLGQMTLFETETDDDIIRQIKELDIGAMTPLDALNKLNELQCRIRNRWTS